MKKYIIFLLSFIFLANCSFDNKTGIWKDGSKVVVQDISELDINKNFPVSKLEDVFPIPKLYQEERSASIDTKIDLNSVFKNNNWLETYLTNGNNIENIYYKNNHNLVLKSSKLSKFPKSSYEIKKKLIKPLIYNNGLVSFDHKGTIYIYSTKNKKKIFEYNFYKKRFKKYEKYIYLAVEKGIIYAADNLGYIYALNIATEQVIWAKNLGIPFRSNIKLADNYIFLANQDNNLYALNKNNGEVLWQFGTQPSFFKSNFVNNLAVDEIKKNIFFLNTSGELYSLNYITRNVNWLLNFNKSTQSTENQIFKGVPIVTNNKNLIISNGLQLSNYNLTKNEIEWQRPISINIKPTITKNNIFHK